MPFYKYSESYLLMIDEFNTVLLFFIFLQYSMIWYGSLYIVTCSIHSLNTHPAIVVIHEKIDMQTCIILFSIVFRIHLYSLQCVGVYVALTVVLYFINGISIEHFVVVNAVVFGLLEIYVLVQFVRYAVQLKELLQWRCVSSLMCRQTLISVEIKRKQYLKALGELSIPIVGLILRVLIQLLPTLSFIAGSVAIDGLRHF